MKEQGVRTARGNKRSVRAEDSFGGHSHLWSLEADQELRPINGVHVVVGREIE